MIITILMEVEMFILSFNFLNEFKVNYFLNLNKEKVLNEYFILI